MSTYTIADQPDVADNQKVIIKTESFERKTQLIIHELLWEYGEYCDDIRESKDKANAIIDELTEINKLIPVKNIPEKLQ